MGLSSTLRFPRSVILKGFVHFIFNFTTLNRQAYDSCFRLSACETTLTGTSFTYVPGGVHVVYDQGWLEGSKGIANITVVNNSFAHIGAPPYASNMGQVLDHDPDVVNLYVANNVVEQ